MGGKYSVVEVQSYRYRCSNENCEYSEVTEIPFKSKEHLLTEPLREYAETQARYLGIDEIKLHDGYRYATLIMNMETGCILWLHAGKKKKVVYDFIDHVGLEWMSKVEAVSSDMNTDFEEAFKEKCSHLKIVLWPIHHLTDVTKLIIGQI